MTGPTDGLDVPEEIDTLDSVEEMIDRHPLVQLFGNSARAKVLAVLLDAQKPLNPDTIQKRAGINHQTWYNVRDGRGDDPGLLDTGLVQEVDQIGNSPLYAVPDPQDDLRTEWLQDTRDWTAAVMYHDREPPTADEIDDVDADGEEQAE